MPRPRLPEAVARLVDAHNWLGARAIAAPSECLTVAIEALLARPQFDAWPRLLALAIAAGDFPRREYERLRGILRLLHDLDLRVFDGESAHDIFATLKRRVTIYRGTVVAEYESREFGVCWTLDRRSAERFALRSAIAQRIVTAAGRPDVAAELVPDGFDSPPVVLTATVRRSDLTGVLCVLGEREVLVRPQCLRDVMPQSLAKSNVSALTLALAVALEDGAARSPAEQPLESIGRCVDARCRLP